MHKLAGKKVLVTAGAQGIGLAISERMIEAGAHVAILIAAFLNNWLGVQGLNISTAATGLVDAHAAAVSVASLVSAQKITSQQAVWPVLIGLSSNTLMKAIVAYKSGGVQYATRIVPGLVLMIAAVWVGAWLTPS